MDAPTRKAGPERRREIACAALRIIGEEGLTALSTATLAKAVGLSTGALFRHFRNLEEIFGEMVRCAILRIEGTFPSPDLPPLERIAGLARRRIAVLGSERGLAWLFRSEQARLVLPADAAAELAAVAAKTREYLLAALVEGAAGGTIRSDVAPDVLLVPVLGTIHALIGSAAVHGTFTTGDGGTERVLSGLSTLLAPPGVKR